MSDEPCDNVFNRHGSSVALPPRLRDLFGFDRADDSAWFSELRTRVQSSKAGRIGSFELIAEAGRGGQGLVYRARQAQPAREVALKRLAAGVFATPGMRARFEREIEAAAALNHPNIVTLFGRELVDGQPLLVMQWIDGVSFDSWARPPGRQPRSVEQIARTFLAVCDAIHYAHQRGVIHRDLKPSNVLVDADNRPHVLDFGLAKLDRETSNTLTREGDFLGTPAYAAPEQIGVIAHDVDVRTDGYALGIILYEALTGRRPFGDASTLASLVECMQHGNPPPPSAHCARIPRDLDAITLTAIAREPARRYGSVEALGADIRRYLAGDAVLAHPPSVNYRLRKFLRRNALASVTSVLIALAIVVLGAVSTVQAARERSLRIAAEDARQSATQQTEIAAFEARRQRETADALLNVLLKAKGHVLNRHTISTKTLAGWFADLVGDQQLIFDLDTQIELNTSLADLYRWVRERETALEYSQRALTLLDEQGIADDPRRCTILTHMAETLTKMNRAEEAERVAREAIAAAQASVGIDSPEGALATEELARALFSLERIDEMKASLQTAYEIYARIDSTLSARVPSKLRIADVMIRDGQLDEARTLLLDCLAFLDTTDEVSSNPVAWFLSRLSTVDFLQGRYEDAERCLARVVAYRLKSQGVLYGRTADDLRRHAWVLHALQRYEEAIVQLETALVFYEHELQSPHDTARVRFEMSVALLAAGREDEGRRQLARAVSLGATTSPADPAWNLVVTQLETAIRGNGFRHDEHLRASLGDYRWLMFDFYVPPPW